MDKVLGGTLALGLLAGCTSGSGAAPGVPADASTASGGAAGSGRVILGDGGGARGKGGNGATLDASACPGPGCHAFTASYPGRVWEADTSVAIGTNGYVAATWMTANEPMSAPTVAWHVGYTFSTDFGSTWAPVQIIRSPISGDDAWDPRVAVDAANNFYLAIVSVDPGFTESHIYVMTAPVGTATFSAPSEVTDPTEGKPNDAGQPTLYSTLDPRPFYDTPMIAVTKNQQIVVTYSRFDVGCDYASGSCVSDIMVARSANAKSWSRAQITSRRASVDGGPNGGPSSFATIAFPCVSAATNRLWVTYNDYARSSNGNIGAAPVGVMLQYSDDDGATWSPTGTTVVAPIDAAGVPEAPFCAGDGGDVWVEYVRRAADCKTCVASSIQVARSTDGGRTFGAPVDALDATTSFDAAGAWHATLARESSGNLVVAYYGGGINPGDEGAVYYVRSTDKGASFGKATVIKAPIRLTSGGFGLGNYLGVATAGGWLYTAYTDNWGNASHVGFARLALP
jgi:hypothetical protein